MTGNKLKIFLSYHKDTPCYKSGIFEPIQVGAGLGVNDETKLSFAIKDNTEDNISNLNPYYCELTGHYWVLKNYIDKSEEEYIGFAHYRRLPDLLGISDEDFPSIYGINYPQSIELFNELNNSDIYSKIKNYDIIYPCSCYMYEQTVNPQLRENEQHYNVYDHFFKEHNNNLLDCLKEIIEEYYPEYLKSIEECYRSEKSHFYNIYIMKKDIIKNFLKWQFDILDKLGASIGGWEQDKYKRMGGFIGETLMSVWLIKNKSDYKTGYVPIYMIDFEAEYIENANYYHQQGDYLKEIAELEKLMKISDKKFEIALSITELFANQKDTDNSIKYLNLSEEYAKTSDDFYQLAQISNKYTLIDNSKITEYYEISLKKDENNKNIAISFLNFAEGTHDINISKSAWQSMKKYGLSDSEQKRYEHFEKIYNMISKKN